SELEALERIAAERGGPVDIGLRVAAGEAARDGRFGFRPDAIVQLARRFRPSMTHLRFVGLHVHLGTNITDPARYGQASRMLCDLAVALQDARILDLSYVDLGGGFATNCGFRDRPPIVPPSADEYATAISRPIRERFGLEGPLLIVEPGRYLVD